MALSGEYNYYATRSLFKTQNALLNNITAFMDLFLINDQRWSKTYNVSMSGFCQKAVIGKVQTELPGRFAFGRVVDHNGI